MEYPMYAVARRYAGGNPLRWLIVPLVIWCAIVELTWRRVMTWIGILLMAALLVALLVGVSIAAGWGMGQILIWVGLI